MFLAFEGVDGVGKSTQVELLREWFVARGRDPLVVREPGGTRLGEDLRALLLAPSTGDLCAEAEVALFMAARAQLVDAVIAPALAASRPVISDRFHWSSVVYQGIVGEVGIDEVLSIAMVITRGILPELTFWLDLDPRQALAPLDGDDRLESRGLEFQLRLRDGFRKLHEIFPDRIVRIDARAERAAVHSSILAAIDDRCGSDPQEPRTRPAAGGD